MTDKQSIKAIKDYIIMKQKVSDTYLNEHNMSITAKSIGLGINQVLRELKTILNII